MPDHIHLLWVGIFDGSEQRNAAKYFRKQLNLVLEKLDARFQQQGYEHVLREEEREQTVFENVVEYIARNSERAGLVKENCFREYPYADCLLPGYPELKLWQEDFWDRFWRIYSYLQENGLMQI
jgi:hypothetical protein